ncbi:MAG: hypothetical protein IKU81_04095 [Oscillibacter sp.]|nr:hypothetical protein [Oscillibacter sp.]
MEEMSLKTDRHEEHQPFESSTSSPKCREEGLEAKGQRQFNEARKK